MSARTKPNHKTPKTELTPSEMAVAVLFRDPAFAAAFQQKWRELNEEKGPALRQ